jgi:TatA/E family protein of Tat protein translocase
VITSHFGHRISFEHKLGLALKSEEADAIFACGRPTLLRCIEGGRHMGFAGPDLIVIMIVALIIFGPRRLPELGKKFGEGLAQFRKASDEFKRTWENEVQTEKYRIQPARPAYVEPAPPVAAEPVNAAAVPDTQPITSPIPEGADEEHAAAMLLGTVPSVDPSTRIPSASEPTVKDANQDWM